MAPPIPAAAADRAPAPPPDAGTEARSPSLTPEADRAGEQGRHPAAPAHPPAADHADRHPHGHDHGHGHDHAHGHAHDGGQAAPGRAPARRARPHDPPFSLLTMSATARLAVAAVLSAGLWSIVLLALA
jgi:hypothetical protein